MPDGYSSGAMHDMLDFDHTIFADFNSAKAAMTQVGSDVVITIDRCEPRQDHFADIHIQ
jgi:hypothetical protein